MPAYGTRDRDVKESRPRNDVYTVLLLISLVAMIIGCVLLYLDYSQYPDKKPEQYQPPALKSAPAPGGAGAPATPPQPPPAQPGPQPAPPK